MKFPGIGAFKKELARRPGFVLFATKPGATAGDDTDLMAQGVLDGDQVDELQRIAFRMMSEQRARAKGRP